jgi:tRNA modification GTPase
VTGDGIATLLEAIGQRLVPVPPPRGAAVPFTPSQLAALDEAGAAIDRRDEHAAANAMQSLLVK